MNNDDVQLQDLTTDVDTSITHVDDFIVHSIVDDDLSTCLKSSSDDINVLMATDLNISNLQLLIVI